MELTGPAADAGPMSERTTGAADDGYGGLLTAFPYAVRRSDSRALRLYAVASALLGVLVVAVLALAAVVWFANPSGLFGERAMLGVIAIAVLVPLFAPVLLVARRHRHGRSDAGYDRALGLAGFAFVLSLWVGLVVSVPPGQQAEPTGVLAPVAAALYALPGRWAFVPPLVGVAIIVLAHRLRG